MRVRTLFHYLTGGREAILKLAADRRAVWLGLLFVLSAGFAREYDGEDLLHEPWHLAIPLGASLVSSFVLFTLVYGPARLKGAEGPPFFSAYRSFLGLFWLTAPLAWLYAVPYERFLSPADAVRANLLTLALVAAWRVALMVRVVNVLMGYGNLAAVVLVMTFADAVALATLQFVPLPVINIMGGVRMSEGEELLTNVAVSVLFLGGCSFPLWLIGAFAAIVTSKPAWRANPPGQSPSLLPGRVVRALALASLAVWAFVLPFTQPEQRLRRSVERDLKAGRIDAALAEMSAHSREDFPPHWDPPPRPAYGENVPDLLAVLGVIAERPPAPWVRKLYLRKLSDRLRLRYGISDEEIEKAVDILARLPEGREIVEEITREEPHSAAAEKLRVYFNYRAGEKSP